MPNIKFIIILIALAFLNFLTFPYFGNVDKVPKIIFLFLVFSLFCLFYFKPHTEIKITRYSRFILILFSILLCSSFFSQEVFWSFLALSILFLAFSLTLVTAHFSIKIPDLFQHFCDAMLLIGVVAALLGLYEFVHFSLMGPSREMLIPHLIPPDSSIRVGGVYGQPNLFAVLLSVTILCFFFRYLHVDFKSPHRYAYYLKYLPFILVGFVFFATQSRAGLLGLSLTLLVLAWFYLSGKFIKIDKDRRREMYLLFFLLFFSYTIFRAGFVFIPEGIRELNVADEGTSIRFLLWASAFLIFRDNPLWGVGLDNFRFVQNSYSLKAHDVLGFVSYEAMGSTPWAHNEVLQILSETGIIVFLIIIVFFVFFFLYFFKSLKINSGKIQDDLIYSHILILPFFIQSFFSWPLRHPPLLFLFFIILGLCFSSYGYISVTLGKKVAFLLRSLALFSFFVICLVVFFEYQIGRFKNELRINDDVDKTKIAFEVLETNIYSRYRILRNAVPFYVREALSREDLSLAAWVLPYCEKIASIEGARWQWYNLARIYLKVDDQEGARSAIKKAIDLRPSDETTWAFLHYLNMLKASRQTGRPIEDFTPLGKQIDFSRLELLGE